MTEDDPQHGSSIEAERAVLAAMLLSADACRRGAELLQPQAFYRVYHRKMFEGLSALSGRGENPDSVTLHAELERMGAVCTDGWPVAISLITDYAGSSANLEEHARIVRSAHGRRRARKIGSRLAQAMEDPSQDLSEVVQAAARELELARDQSSNGAMGERLMAQSYSGAEMLTRTMPPVEPIVGTGLLVKGGLAILAGPGGIGKTFLALQLKRSVATGSNFLGYEVARGRAGLLELEMPAATIRDRLKAGIEGPAAQAMEFLVMPEGLGKLTDPAAADAVTLWCEKKALSLVIMDPLHDLHDGDEKDEAQVDALTHQLDRIRRRTGVSIVLLHHMNKAQLDRNTPLRTVVRMGMRGSGRLFDDCDTVLGMLEQAGRILLVFAKTRYCQSPESVALHQNGSGYFDLTDTVEQVMDKNTEKVERCLLFAGEGGCLMAEIMSTTGLGRQTVLRHLAHVEHVRLREGNATRYFHRKAAGAPQEELRDF